MSEIPGPVWMGVGGVIGGFSLFLGFIRPVEYNMFFKLMAVIGAIMILFGFIRLKLKDRNKTNMIEEVRLRQNPHGYQNKNMNQGYQTHNQNYAQPHQMHRPHTQGQQQHNTHQHRHHTTHQQTVSHSPHQQQHRQHHAQQHGHHQIRQQTNQKSRFCHQCGTPLLKHQQFCAICGSKI